MKRTSLTGLATACLAAVSLIAVGCGGSDDNSAVDQATEAVGGAASTATEAVGGAVTTATGAVGDAAGDAQTIEIPASESALAYAKTTASASPGKITIRMPNPSNIPHNIALQDRDEAGEIVNKGEVSEITADLKAATYTYICTVPGHLEAGMKGTLTVK